MRPYDSTPKRASSADAFSLIEIVLAVGVISFALVGILGLFPVALHNATESQHETQAALIARAIYSDLESQTGATRYILNEKDTESDSQSSSGGESKRYQSRIVVHLSTPQSYYLAFDSDGLLLDDKIGEGEYAGGMSKAGYLAKITVSAPEQQNGGSPLPPDLAQIDITVGAPGAAPEAKRTSYPFVGYLYDGKTN